MSLVLDLAGTVVCAHDTGRVSLAASQLWVRIEGQPVLVRGDLQDRPIGRCSFFTGTNKPCTKTLREQKAWSAFVTIDGVPICLDTTWGMTDAGPGVWRYDVQSAGQGFVSDRADAGGSSAASGPEASGVPA